VSPYDPPSDVAPQAVPSEVMGATRLGGQVEERGSRWIFALRWRDEWDVGLEGVCCMRCYDQSEPPRLGTPGRLPCEVDDWGEDILANISSEPRVALHCPSE
jgi:hypothetical protein